MKTSPSRRHRAGYISFLLVLATGAILTALMFSAYRRALRAQVIESQVQLRLDYSEKEEAILRSIVAIVPNRAIRAMQPGSDTSGTRDPLRWQDIFTESLVLANSRTSISSNMVTALNIPNLRMENTGDGALDTPSKIFAAVPPETGYVSVGINRSLGTGYPPPLTSGDSTTNTRDALYPIISGLKQYDTLAQPDLNSKILNGDGSAGYGLPVATYPAFNRLKYPNINFGYAKPGEAFVAKRNWWAFSVDVADHDDDKTLLAKPKRNFVLSIYEIPSQLSISAASFMSLGKYASGNAWQNVNIDGGMFVGRAAVEGNTAINALAIRREMTLSSGSTIGGQSFSGSPFTPGVRESYQNQKDSTAPVSLVNQTTLGAFFPVSLASESGRAAFIPINRGSAFFDRFDPVENDPLESSGAYNHIAANVLSSTSWNNYSIGAQQCAMRLDITEVTSSTNATPTKLRFQYFLPSGSRSTPMVISLSTGVIPTLPAGYVKVCDEGQTYTLTSASDVAYGVSGGFTFRQGLTGPIAFNNSNFGDPKVGTLKAGYVRQTSSGVAVRSPFEIADAGGQKCVAIYPERMKSFLTQIGAAGPEINNSLVVNVDYSVSGLNNAAKKPLIPCTVNDYGVILRECANLTPFTKGFSLVTNLRLFIGDDFNIVPTSPPSGYTPAVTPSNPTGRYLPPCSLFTPEKRYGVDVDPFAVNLGGQIGSLAKADKVNSGDADAPMVRPLDSKALSGTAIASDRITVNLSQIRHPAELPPITMMNWLVLLEERRPEYQ